MMTPRVLIVDDSLTVRMDLGEAFDAAGIAATLRATLADARAALREQTFDVVILDVLLPDGDGIEFLREIRASAGLATLPVMLLSTEAEVGHRIRGLHTGAEEYVGKPYERSFVLARVRELLRAKQPKSSATTDRKSVLVIDDSITFREGLKQILEGAGYAVTAAVSGEEGLRVALDLRPTAIVVDGVLPGIDGATVIKRIRADAILRSTPCILLTASGESNGELAALEAGADAYVRKEEDAQVILARVSAVLRSAGSPPATGPAASLLGSKRILAVDPSATHLRELATQLREEGYEAVLASTGEEALQLLEVQAVDCILLEFVLAGLSGHETCQRIKSSSAWRDIPLIVYTGVAGQRAMIDAINAGADDFIAKSSDFEVVRARVRAQLRRKQFEDENRNSREQFLQKELAIAMANSARELAEARAVFTEELERKNAELEAFSYSVSHDLRAPLRSIDGFSRLLLENCRGKLDAQSQDYLSRVCDSAKRMGELIDDLLLLSRVSQAELRRETVDVAAIANEILARLQETDRDRIVERRISSALTAEADPRLLRIALENLLGNAWKFTVKVRRARIEVGLQPQSSGDAFFVRDNGAGFEMAQADKLFSPFQRLHNEDDFPGTGIGLATVQRIVSRHGGRIWAESPAGRGATFYFTLPPAKPERWLTKTATTLHAV